MCGTIPAGHKAYTIMIRLGANENVTRVKLDQNLSHIRQIRLDEYAIRNPNGGAVDPDLWRIDFQGTFYSSLTTNATGIGYPIIVDNSVLTHVVYTRPRIMSEEHHAKMTFLQLSIKDENGANVTFDTMTLFITVVCQLPTWSADRVMAQTHLIPVDNFDNDARVPGLVGPPINHLVNTIKRNPLFSQ